ncbi:TetR/AcrR family transcriptional regulator [Actinoplanes xinjiangensis]|uniref:TetR/AcrR family transcriptional regulator n=1 Tax=Actinoplanes xinjiangensis TaxID=512350 RepID=UPI003440DF19
MATRAGQDGLSRDRIVATAIEILDAAGESGLTFRALGTRLSTGPGAIYWHVANKDELLAAATGAVLADVLGGDEADIAPADAIRAIALGMFDAIDAHPWIGYQLAGLASRSASLRIIERIGQQVQALGVPGDGQFFATSALFSYILGVAGQNAANARSRAPGGSRDELLGAEAELWAGLDAAEFPFLRGVAAQMGDHDDREQFLAGIDLILAGMGAVR